MATFLRVLLLLEVVSGLCLTLAVLLASNENWGVLYFLVLFAGLNALPVFIGLCALIFKSSVRKLAAWVTLLPFAFLVIPITVRSAMGNPVNPRWLLFVGVAAAALVFLLAIVRPKSVARHLPAALFRSKAWNVLLLASLVVGWLIVVAAAVVTGPALLDTANGQGSPGMAGATMLIVTVVLLIGLALLSALVAVWAWLGLNGSIEDKRRKLHTAQLVVASPGFLLGVLFLLKQPISG